MSDFYEVLGLERNCNDQQIKATWKELARRYQTDKNRSPEVEEKFKKIMQAYEVLSNPGKRLIYDSLSDEEVMRRFKEYFNKRKAENRYITLDVSLREVYTGNVREKNVQKKIICSTCKAKSSTCDICFGSGTITRDNITIDCVMCLGSGIQPCYSCEGTGTETINKVYEVVIEKGIESGHEIRIIGEADEEPETLPGDLTFIVRIEPHPHFTRAKKNLCTVVRLPSDHESQEASQVCINTVDHRMIQVNIPKGTTKVEVDDEGLPDYDDSNIKGKLIVIIAESEDGNLHTATTTQTTSNDTKPSSSSDAFNSQSETDHLRTAASTPETKNGTQPSRSSNRTNKSNEKPSSSSDAFNSQTETDHLRTAASTPETKNDTQPSRSSNRTNKSFKKPSRSSDRTKKSKVVASDHDLIVPRRHKIPIFECPTM